MSIGQGAPTAHHSLYDRDIAAWAEEQAHLIRTRDFAAVDIENVAEEIGDLAKGQRSELRGCLSVLLKHLIKWRYQPGHWCVRWKVAIRNRRSEVDEVLSESPSLRPALHDVLPRAFRNGVTEVFSELGIDHLPETCPWTIEQVMSPDFLPD